MRSHTGQVVRPGLESSHSDCWWYLPPTATQFVQEHKRAHHAVAREPSRARLCPLRALHSLDVAVGDHSWRPPKQWWSRAHPSCLVAALTACDPLAHFRDSPSSPLSSQHHYLSSGSFLGFPLLQNWRCSGHFSSSLLRYFLGHKHPDTVVSCTHFISFIQHIIIYASYAIEVKC